MVRTHSWRCETLTGLFGLTLPKLASGAASALLTTSKSPTRHSLVRDLSEWVPRSPRSATLLHTSVRTHLLTCLHDIHNLAIGHSRGGCCNTCMGGCGISCDGAPCSFHDNQGTQARQPEASQDDESTALPPCGVDKWRGGLFLQCV